MGKSFSRGGKCPLLFSYVTNSEDDGGSVGGGGGAGWAVSGEEGK